MKAVHWVRVPVAFAAATLTAVLTMNALGVIQNPCRGSWSECTSYLWSLIAVEFLVASLVALVLALPIYLVLRAVKLLAWWHLALAGAAVSALGGVCLGFVQFGPYFEISSLAPLFTMGLLAGLVFWVVA